MTATPEIRVLSDWPGFLAVAGAWGACHARAGGSLFSSVPWLIAQEAAFGLPGKPAFVTLWRDGRMTAAAPLVETRPRLSKLIPRYRPPALAPWTCKYSGFAELLAETDDDLRHLCRAVVRLAGRRVLDLELLRDDRTRAAMAHACTAAGRRLTLTPAFDSAYVDLPATWDDYLDSRSRNFRKSLRKAMARLEECGGTVERVTYTPARWRGCWMSRPGPGRAPPAPGSARCPRTPNSCRASAGTWRPRAR
ncbi:MAG: hypothetical protein R3D63_13320 [Paracoccaceae bacterium]